VLEGPTVLVLGSEGHGLRKNIEKLCDDLVHIDGNGTGAVGLVDSLNVSVAGGVLLHQLTHGGRSPIIV